MYALKATVPEIGFFGKAGGRERERERAREREGIERERERERESASIKSGMRRGPKLESGVMDARGGSKRVCAIMWDARG